MRIFDGKEDKGDDADFNHPEASTSALDPLLFLLSILNQPPITHSPHLPSNSRTMGPLTSESSQLLLVAALLLQLLLNCHPKCPAATAAAAAAAAAGVASTIVVNTLRHYYSH